MMDQGLHSIYHDILRQVLLLEERKQSISVDLLLTRNVQKRLALMHNFLTCDLKKHRLFEYAAALAFSNQDEAIIAHIKQFYPPEASRDTTERIKKEIDYSLESLKVMKKSLQGSPHITFSDRRLCQEVSKYVLSQAKIYCQLKGGKP